MTRFLDVRLAPRGGGLAASVSVNELTDAAVYQSMKTAQLVSDIAGRHVLVGTHGFNVDRANGLSSLSNWERLLQLQEPSVFVGVLWPGDSIWAHGLDYPEEPRIANDAGLLIADFLNTNFRGAASISLASHSLGARVVLSIASRLSLPIRRLMVMAGAIDNDCLNNEFRAAAGRVTQISALASKGDFVLHWIFPSGNLLGGIVTQGHPWWRGALGRWGPADPKPANFRAPFQIPDNWDYGHGDYLNIDPPPAPVPLVAPIDVPPNGSGEPLGGPKGWRQTWSAVLTSTRFR